LPKPLETVKSITAAQNKSHPFWRLLPFLRWALVPYLIAVVLCGLFTVVIAGYGLAHGSEKSNAAFLSTIAGAMLIAAVLPLSFLLKSQATWVRALQVLGMGLFCGVLFLFSKLMFYLYFEPALWTQQFKTVTNPISIDHVDEAQLVINETPIGLRVTVHIKLPNEVALDRYGAALLDSISSMNLSAPQLTGNNRMAPFADGLRGTVTFNGKPIDDLPGVKEFRARSYGVPPDGKAKLPSGIYQLSQTFWLNGLRRPDLNDYADNNPTPCKIDPLELNQAYRKDYEQHLQDTNNTPLAVSFGGRLSLRDRNGYRYFGRTAPIKYRYDHAQWTKALNALPLQSCKTADDAKKINEAEKAAAQKAKDDKAGYDNGHLFYKENPLYAEACAGSVDAINKRMQAEDKIDNVWVPRFALSDIMRECTIQTPQIAVFKLLAPSLYTRSKLGLANGENEYCNVLKELHSYRNLPFLSALSDLKLPLDCADKEMWRAGIAPLALGTQPSGYSNEEDNLSIAAASRDDGIAWVALLLANQIDICKPQMITIQGSSNPPAKAPGKTLLDKIVRHSSPALIQAVLDAGCSPHSQVKLSANTDILRYDDTLPASVWWMFRRHRSEQDSATSPLPDSNKALIAKLDQQLSPKVAQLLGSPELASVFVANRRIVDDSDTDLLAALVKAGLPLDYTGARGTSWFYPAYGNDWHPEKAARYFAMLDKLSDVQLKQLINPVVRANDKPRERMRTLDKPEYPTEQKPFRDYACKRKVMVCD
jgi:hypothetical protein